MAMEFLLSILRSWKDVKSIWNRLFRLPSSAHMRITPRPVRSITSLATVLQNFAFKSSTELLPSQTATKFLLHSLEFCISQSKNRKYIYKKENSEHDSIDQHLHFHLSFCFSKNPMLYSKTVNNDHIYVPEWQHKQENRIMNRIENPFSKNLFVLGRIFSGMLITNSL